MTENIKGKAELERRVEERRKELGRVAHNTYDDARTFLAATGLVMLTSKGIDGLDASSTDDVLRIAAEVPLYAAAIGASITQVLAGIRTASDIIEDAVRSASYLNAKRRLSNLDEAAGQRLRNSSLTGAEHGL